MTSRAPVGGLQETDLVFPAGRTGAVTLYSAEYHDEVISPPDDISFGSGTFVTMPTEISVREILVPAGYSDPATARVAVYARRHHPEQVYEQRTSDLMLQRETIEYLGSHDHVPDLRDVPQHADAVRRVLENRGWFGIKFDVYRCRVEYPMMHSLIVAKIDPLRREPTGY
jgi:hypothetical protein